MDKNNNDTDQNDPKVKVILTFILKKVILVSKSTVDLRSWSRARSDAGKLVYNNIFEINLAYSENWGKKIQLYLKC